MDSQFSRSFKTLMLGCVSATLLAGCMSTSPKMGGGDSTVSGAASGATAEGNNQALERCDKPLGTLSVFEDNRSTWWYDYRARYPKLGSTLPVIRLMVQQSNCFVVVERGRSMAAMNTERQLAAAGQLRGNANVGGGQMVAADYTLSPEIQFAEKSGGLKAAAGAFLGSVGSLIGGSLDKNEAATTLLLIDNRSGVQVSAAIGSASNYDFGLLGGMFGGGVGGGASAYTRTPEGKVIAAAFADSFNQMVKALRNYKPQQVEGGLGGGGALQIGGDDDQTPQATQGASVPASPMPVVATPAPAPTYTTSSRNYNFEIDEYDEDALKDYYNALKQAAKMSSGFSAYASMADSQQRQGVLAALGMFTSSLESHRIDLESWPLAARQQAWASMGKRIEKQNALFEKNRALAVKNESIPQDVRNLLASVQLVTKETLLAQ